MIELRDLTVRYPRATRRALDGVSLVVRPGEMLLLAGPSGGGKSTLGLCLAGLIPSSLAATVGGAVLFDGRDAATLTAGERAARVGVVFQDPDAQFCLLTVEDEVAFGLENLAVPPGEMEGRIAEALARVGLAARRAQRLDRLSGGQKQRLALACALARRPAVLFLDEPTANLDPATRHGFFTLLAQLRREQPELAIVIVEHLLDDLVGTVDRVALLDRDGRLARTGSPAEVFGTDGDELDRLGVWLPQVTLLGRELRRAGRALPRLPLTVADAAALFDPLVARRAPPLAPPCAASGAVTGPPAVAVRDLSFGFDTGPEILHGVSLVVPTGSFCALVGPNGSGKTTLASHLVGILRAGPGRVAIGGADLAALPAAACAARAGFVFQNPEHQFVATRVDEELAWGLRVRRRPEAEIAVTVAALLDEFGLAADRRANPFTLSQGQKRRLSVATMLALGQPLLVLDEPTLGQDRHTADALLTRLEGLRRRGVTLLAVTHDLQLVAEHADRVAVLADGRVEAVLPPRALFAADDLLAAASLRPPPLHALARWLDLAFDDGTRPLSVREWRPFCGLAPAGEAP